MKIHREGRDSILIATLLLITINTACYSLIPSRYVYICWVVLVLTCIAWLFVLSFFRIPNRELRVNKNFIIAPCDGEVVVVEEVYDSEYFKAKRLQVSIFMSVTNVHVNRNPISGLVTYTKHHHGKYLFAWHPKSSTENERHSTVYLHDNGKELLAKQIAGALANRIVNYVKVSDEVVQSDEMGFIKFGSRMDILLPLDAEVLVKLGDRPKGGVTAIAKW